MIIKSNPSSRWRVLLKFGAFVLLCSLPWTAQAQGADRDKNGLIEIDTLLMLHNMRHNLAGTSYKSSADSDGDDTGCPAAGCKGYELTGDLDFDRDGDGSTWSGNAEDGFILDFGDDRTSYFPVIGGAGGWLPIGSFSNPFVAVFDGKGHRISNLAIRRNQDYVGLFGRMGGDAAIRNLGLIDNLADYTGSSGENRYIGGLVGRQNGGSITASYATGPADGGNGDFDHVGGLVGRQSGGSIKASYATGVARGGNGNSDYVGGLVGWQSSGSIRESYATGDAYGKNGYDNVGGLVGRQDGGTSIRASHATGDAHGGEGGKFTTYSAIETAGGLVGWKRGGSITASYATGDAHGGAGEEAVGGLVGEHDGGSVTASYATGVADGGDSSDDRVGGLVGWQYGGSITASYARGDADGGSGARDYVGGLVGWKTGGSITASYATGDVDGGSGTGDRAGKMIGYRTGGSRLASYGFGQLEGGEVTGVAGTTRPQGVGNAAKLTAANVEAPWNRGPRNTLGAWDLGTDKQIPALKYNDYDGDGTAFNCGQFPAGACGTLLPGQAVSLKSISAPPALELGGAATLVASLDFGSTIVVSWEWEQVSGREVTLSGADTSELRFTAPDANTVLVFELTAKDSGSREQTQRIRIAVLGNADRDGDGLIEIDRLVMLHNMRHNMEGTSYKSGPASVENSFGCPSLGCIGYELTRNLDFDVDGDGDGTWRENNDGVGFTLDPGDSKGGYFPGGRRRRRRLVADR